MKCNNCGQQNNPNLLRCSSCNAPLTGSMIAPSDMEQNPMNKSQVKCQNCSKVNPADSLRCIECNAPLSGSMVAGKVGEKLSKDTIPHTQKKTGNVKTCGSCGYPSLLQAKRCVHCDHSLVNDRADTSPLKSKPESDKAKKVPAPAKTINPWQKSSSENYCFSLRPIAKKGEKDQKEIIFEGEIIELSRADLDPKNKTITTGIQAKIEYKDGSWALTDQSDLKTTFMRVNGEIDLQSGDIILMGDRLFEFNKGVED